MRKLFKSLALVAAAAMTLASCNKEAEIQQKNADGLYKYSFTILDSKAVIGDSNIEWVAGDQVGMFVGDYKGYAKIDVTTDPKMVVLYSNQAIPAGTMAYAYAPYDADNKTSTPDMTKIVLNSIQSGSAVSAMPLAGVPFEVEEEVEAQNQNGNGAIKFLNLGSLINFKIYSTNEEFQSETVQSVKFESTKTIAGAGYLDLTAVDVEDENTLELTFLDSADEENAVRVDQVVPVAASKDNATLIKMVILPGTFDGTITVTTDVATYTKTMPERTFDRSDSRTFGLDLANCEREEGVTVVEKTLPYEEAFTSNHGDFSINNVSLPAGQSNIWSFDTSYGAKVTAYIGGTNYAAESWLVSPVIDLTDVVSAEITFDQCVNKYMDEGAGTLQVKEYGTDTWTNIPNTYPSLSGTWSAFKEFTVDLTSYAGKKIIFAFKYVSTSEKAGTWEIKNFSAHIVKADPELSYASQTLDLVLGDETAAAQELTNPHDLTVTYSSSNTAVVEVDENTGEITLKAAGSSIITASFAGNDSYKAGSARYTIQVTDPSVTYSDFSWNLAEDETVTKTTEELAWNYRGVTMVVEQAGASTATNNYCPPSQSSTRFYKNSVLTITPYTGSTIGYVEFTATTTGYANALQGSEWSNASASVNGTVVTVNPTDGTAAFSATIGATCGFTQVKVYYLGELETVVTYSITVDDDVENGSISASAEEAQAGATVTLTATPSSGYIFGSWTVTGVTSGNTIIVTNGQFKMPAEGVNVTASFVKEAAGAVSVTFIAGTDTSSSTTLTKDNVTITTTSGTFSRTDNYRIYANNSMTVEVPSGKNITSIVFTISQNTFTTSTGSYDTNSQTWTGSANSVTLSAEGGQVRITEIVVTYE